MESLLWRTYYQKQTNGTTYLRKCLYKPRSARQTDDDMMKAFLKIVNILDFFPPSVVHSFHHLPLRKNSERNLSSICTGRTFPTKCDLVARDVKMQRRGQKQAANALSHGRVCLQ